MDDGGRGDPEVPAWGLPQLSVVSALGRGGRGVVFLAVNRVSGERFALKTIPKASIRGERDKRVGFERRVLSCTRHPLLPRLRGVFESQDLVGYAIDYCPGRDLHTLRKKQIEQTFSNNIIRFYAAELVLALEYLHSSGVIYRDLKPENILIQENGHVMLVDFDLSTELSVQLEPEAPPSSSSAAAKSLSKKRKKEKKTRWLGRFYKRWCNSGISPEGSEGRQRDGSDSAAESGKAKSFVGTEEYVAPEIIIGAHSFEADWWSLGVVLYEMLYGTTPFKGSNRKETFYRILAKTPELVGAATPLRDLIGKLLEKDPRERIGAAEIKGHHFFSGLDWDLILKISRPPFIPPPPAATEDTEGIKGIDVESFVREVFSDNKGENDDNDDKKKENKCAHDDVDEEKNEENTRKGAWVGELNYPLDSNSNNGHEFSIF